MGGIYQDPVLDLSTFDVLPRRDLLHPEYLWNSIQTSRGCPFDCSFCSVFRYMGKAYRQRTASSVLEEGSMQASINVADDPEALKLASQAGCAYVFIDFETTDADSLKGMHKGVNLRTGVQNYRTVVRRRH